MADKILMQQHGNDKANNQQAHRFLKRQLIHVKKYTLATAIFGIASSIFYIIQAWLIASIIYQTIFLQAKLSQSTRLIVLLGCAYVARATVIWLKEFFGFKTGLTIRQILHNSLVKHIKTIGPQIKKAIPSGKLSTTLIEQVEALHNYYAYYYPQMLIVVVVPMIILVIAFSVNWLVGLILLVTAPLIPLFMALIGKGAASINQRHFQSLARLSSHFLDLLQGLVTLKIYHSSKRQTKNIETISDDYRVKTMSVLRVAFISSAALELFATLSIALIAVYLGFSLLEHYHFGTYGTPINLQWALFLLLLAPEFYLPLRELGTHYHAKAEAVGAASEILPILATNADIKTGQQTLKQPINSISLTNLGFAYEENNQVISQLSLELKLGDYLAIVGPSGIGKTTLLSLLLKFIQPSSGNIYVNDQALCEIEHDHWLEQIAYLPQQPKLFPGSIIENIKLANPNANPQQIQQALAAARVQDFTERLPNGLNTIIGENNAGVSGGQAQRIALAQTLLKDVTIILLDEPTANLDDQTAGQINNALRQYASNRIIIQISHKITDPDQFTKIIDLQQLRGNE